MTASVEPRAAVLSRQGRVPDFFIVGHPKCGTTALYEMLRRHPQIYMPDLKEPRFFADDMHTRHDRLRPGVLPETFEDYLELFDSAGSTQLAGEASPFYLTSRIAARQIAEVRPDARIIAILREPASFLRSLHLQFVESQVETKNDLRKAIALEETRRQGRQIPRFAHFQSRVLLYSDHVRYVEQLRRYHAAFPSEQVLVLIYDDLRSDNQATVRTVLRFVGVDEDATAVEVTEANPTVRVRSASFDRLVRAVSIGHGPATRAVKAALKAFAPRPLRRRALEAAVRRVYSEPQPPDESVMRELRSRFKPEVEAVSEYLGRDLVTLWGYDHVG